MFYIGTIIETSKSKESKERKPIINIVVVYETILFIVNTMNKVVFILLVVPFVIYIYLHIHIYTVTYKCMYFYSYNYIYMNICMYLTF